MLLGLYTTYTSGKILKMCEMFLYNIDAVFVYTNKTGCVSVLDPGVEMLL